MTATASTSPMSTKINNLPNQLTVGRLILAIVIVPLVGMKYYQAALVVFLIAASTDWLDGFLARRWGMITVFGRILDPFVDKIIMCGTFICLVGVPDSRVKAWMAVIIVGREILITALRSFLEQQGSDFSASFSGKLKMVLQCLAAALSLYLLSGGGMPDGFFMSMERLVDISLYAAIALTIYSGVGYVIKASSLMHLA